VRTLAFPLPRWPQLAKASTIGKMNKHSSSLMVADCHYCGRQKLLNAATSANLGIFMGFLFFPVLKPIELLRWQQLDRGPAAMSGRVRGVRPRRPAAM
jgi:hypothetical protein